ncbi:MAG: hypothetical protein JSS97_20000 [Actinobacteria bacterium]|nr:hypothetical protein [Actinomycetota bacterium]
MTLYWALTGMPGIESNSRCKHVALSAAAVCPRVRRMLRGLSLANRTAGVWAVGVALVLGGLGSAPAAAAEPQAAGPFSLAFRVAASGGWRAEVIGGSNPELHRAAVILMLSRGGERVTYATRAEVTATTMVASFGALGEIDVHSVPGEGTVTERSDCGGKPVTFDAGRWEGTIRFRGEGGFTTIDASSAAAVVKPFLDLLCFDKNSEGIGGHSPGAHLELKRRDGAESITLSVRKNKRVGPTRIGVEQSEHRGAVQIDRSLRTVEPSSAFDFEIPPGRATVEPPKPFSGSLAFSHHRGSPPRLAGDLKVDLHGRAAVPILGKGHIRARLVRAVLNPSHPF